MLTLATPAVACETWRPLFEAKAKDTGFTSVLLLNDADWIASGVNAVTTARGGKVDERAIEGIMEGFAVDEQGAVYTVGVRQSIWRRMDEGTWKLEHQAPASAKFGRSQGMLAGAHLVPYEGRALLVAYGDTPESLLVRSGQGVWEAPDHGARKELASYVFEGPSAALPNDCVRSYWRWSGTKDGLVACRDLRAFAYRGGKFVPAGTMPKACNTLGDVAQRREEIFARCGADSTVYRFADGSWKTTGVKRATAIDANERCVIATTRRSVLRQCLP